MADENKTFYEHCLQVKDELTRKIILVDWVYKICLN